MAVMTKISVKIPSDILAIARIAAQDRRWTISQLIRVGLEQYTTPLLGRTVDQENTYGDSGKKDRPTRPVGKKTGRKTRAARTSARRLADGGPSAARPTP